MLILDINIPIYSGLNVFVKIKDMFEKSNEARKEKLGESSDILRPFTCYLSQSDYEIMSQFIDEDERTECYLEKPVAVSDIVAILRLLDLK